MKIGGFGKGGLAGVQILLMVFGVFGFAGMIGGELVSGNGFLPGTSAAEIAAEAAAATKLAADIAAVRKEYDGLSSMSDADIGESLSKVSREMEGWSPSALLAPVAHVPEAAVTVLPEVKVVATGYGSEEPFGPPADASKGYGSDEPFGPPADASKGYGSDEPFGPPAPAPVDEKSTTPGKDIWAGGGDALISGLKWAGMAFVAGQMIGSALGMSSRNSMALATALAAGVGTYKVLASWAKTSSGAAGMSPGLIGAGVGVAVFLLLYKDVKTEIVEFNCMPWQAPNGGDLCEVCNDETLPCSEYRCKSLGQSCDIVNAGTEEERCVYVNPRDVNPPVINPNYGVLSRGHEYKNVKSSPPGPGFEIVNLESGDGCLKAFTPLEFGLTLSEPAQCKIDFNHTNSFDEMVAYVGGSNLYSYNHSERFSLPGAKELSGAGFVLMNGKDFVFYLRCKDKNGNENSAEYAVKLCVDPSPDTTPPRIEATSIMDGGCVAENTEVADVVFYVNEPSSCRWGFLDQDYSLMTNNMSCSNSYDQINAAQLFSCRTELTGIPRDGVTYFIRCADKISDRQQVAGGRLQGDMASDVNVMRESFEFRLRGSTGLVLKNLRPNGSVFGGVSPAPVELYAETLLGCNNGLAVCDWSSNGENWIEFFDTNNEDGIHTQRLDLPRGNHEYFVRCIDEGGNVATESVSFNVNIDTSAPAVARIYEEDGMLKIVTVRDSECSYSLLNCDFSFDEGTEMPYGNTTVHVADWAKDNTYFIKCRDEFLNEGADCSIVVRPTESFL